MSDKGDGLAVRAVLGDCQGRAEESSCLPGLLFMGFVGGISASITFLPLFLEKVRSHHLQCVFEAGHG